MIWKILVMNEDCKYCYPIGEGILPNCEHGLNITGKCIEEYCPLKYRK